MNSERMICIQLPQRVYHTAAPNFNQYQTNLRPASTSSLRIWEIATSRVKNASQIQKQSYHIATSGV